MIELFTQLVESNYFEPLFLMVFVGIPLLALFAFFRQPAWYQNEQSRKYAKVTLVIAIIGVIVLALVNLGIIE